MASIIFLLLAGNESRCQEKITEIRFEGLSHTKELFLQQYLTSKVDGILDSSRLANDRQQLLNLAILSSVEIRIDRLTTGTIVIFQCMEMINTLPVFAFGTTNDTFWCKVGLQSLNLSGVGDQLVAYYQYYDRHSVYLSYKTDRIKNSNWGFSSSLIRWATIEPLVIENTNINFNYTNYTAYGSVIRFLTFQESLDGGIGFFNEKYEEQQQGAVDISKIIQGKKLLSKLIFRSNHQNYSTFYVDGFFNQLNIEFIHSRDQVENFITIFNDFRYFKKFRRFNWANRLRTGISTNDENPFAPFVLDSYLNIRGVGNRVDRGTGSIVINTELRYTIFDHNMLAAQGVGFIDFGTWRKPGGTLSDFTKSENMRAFTGLGFRLIYKRAFDTMLRIDYGYDYKMNAGIVIGIGQYF